MREVTPSAGESLTAGHLPPYPACRLCRCIYIAERASERAMVNGDCERASASLSRGNAARALSRSRRDGASA